MKNADKNNSPTSIDSQLDAINTDALDDVTGGCGACGQTCANGPAPAAAATSNLPGLFAAFSAFAQR